MTERQGAARKSDPDTSREAADMLDASPLDLAVVAALRSFGPAGATAEQIAEQSGIDKQSVTPRLAPLAERKIVKDSGTRRRNRSGRRAIVWILNTTPTQGAFKWIDADEPTGLSRRERLEHFRR